MRGIVLPRVLVISGFFLASLGIFAVGEIRTIAYTKGSVGIEDIARIDFLSLNPVNNVATSPEIINAANLVHASSVASINTYGGQMLNRFVFQYIPAQIVGADVKNALMGTPWPEEILYKTLNYVTPTGTTQTGVATAYLEYWYFGWIFFFFTAYILGVMWKQALVGPIWTKSLYAAAMVPSFLTITSNAAYFFVFFPLFIIVSGLVVFVVKYVIGGKIKIK